MELSACGMGTGNGGPGLARAEGGSAQGHWHSGTCRRNREPLRCSHGARVREEGGLAGVAVGEVSGIMLRPLTLNGGVVVVGGAPGQAHLALLQQVTVGQLQLWHLPGAP